MSFTTSARSRSTPRYIARVLNRDLADNEVVTPLVYDRFSALALTDAINALMHRQLLAVHGAGDTNADTLDYRFTVPHRTQKG